jgi:Protein of unknown function (DUF2637)
VPPGQRQTLIPKLAGWLAAAGLAGGEPVGLGASWFWGARSERGGDRWIRWTTIGCVALLALIAGTVSYLHMHMLVARHGQPGWVAALAPLSLDGLIVAASTTLLADSQSGRPGGALPWALFVAGSVASLAANVAVAEPTLIGRVIAAWPSFALTASYELLTRRVGRGAADTDTQDHRPRQPWSGGGAAAGREVVPQRRVVGRCRAGRRDQRSSGELQRQWAPANRGRTGSCPAARRLPGLMAGGAVGSARQERRPGWCLRWWAWTRTAAGR